VICPALAQKAAFETDHKFHLDQLRTAKDSLYKSILTNYDRHIASHPADFVAQLQKCKLIQAAYYDSNEDYNPNYDEASACAQALTARFPDNPEVLLYRAEYLYGDSVEMYLQELEARIDIDRKTWDPFKWQVYDRLAKYYAYGEGEEGEQKTEVVHYGELASLANDTLDNSLLVARAYKDLGKSTEAIEVLREHLDSTNVGWELNQKGTLLLELGAAEEAIRVLQWAEKKTDGNGNASSLAKAMIENGHIEEARPFLYRDYSTSRSWAGDGKLHALLKYDLQYGTADSSKANYRRFTDEKFFNDPLGIYRLQLFAKAPFAGWSIADVGRILMLAALLVIVFLFPYAWILPLHYWGTYRRNRGVIVEPATFDWGLRHFWVAAALWMVCDVLATLLFDYTGVISYINDDIVVDNVSNINKTTADMNVFFMIASLVFCTAMLKRDDIVGFVNKLTINRKDIGTGIALAFLLRFGILVYALILRLAGVDLTESPSVVASMARDAVLSINTYFNPFLGFLLIVIIVPFYEEILFRGIFLSAMSRHIKFLIANIIQSLAFAAVHQDLKFFPFYFVFGMLAGHWTRKTGSLIAGTSMHMVNNFIAFIAIVR
jgi:membrane protease YdiL (CAAX protease family)/tetratricopeptide (TPR) repeat protein